MFLFLRLTSINIAQKCKKVNLIDREAYTRIMQYSQVDISQFGTILGIWAHPDDEVFSAGGLLAAAVANGQRVILITASDGAAGETADEQQWPKSQLHKIRTQELEKSLEVLGVSEHHWLGCEDGKIADTPQNTCIDQIVQLIGQEDIDTIITFEETGVTGHPDHIAVHHWAVSVAQKIGVKRLLCATENSEFYNEYGRLLDQQFNVYFNVKRPKVTSCIEADVCVVLDDTLATKKHVALLAHKSQTQHLNNTDFGRKALLAMCRKECFELKRL